MSCRYGVKTSLINFIMLSVYLLFQEMFTFYLCFFLMSKRLTLTLHLQRPEITTKGFFWDSTKSASLAIGSQAARAVKIGSSKRPAPGVNPAVFENHELQVAPGQGRPESDWEKSWKP
jgi:hypothetical protein